MATLASHEINKFFNDYQDRDIAFTKSIIRVTGLEAKKIFLKVKGDQWPCILYSCSMRSAKVISNFNKSNFEALKESNNALNLRLSFFPPDAKSPIQFFVPAVIKGYKNFNDSNSNLFIISLEFNKKPPDDLIEILGKILREKDNFEKRGEKRVTMEPRIAFNFGLKTNKAIIAWENKKIQCILRNCSNSGANILISGKPEEILNKSVILYLFVQSMSSNLLDIEGTVIRYELIENQKNIFGYGIQFFKDKIPFEYQILINEYFDKYDVPDKKKNQEKS